MERAPADEETSHSFPTAGIRLSHVVDEFLVECGGEEMLVNLTTTQVCERFVKPLTTRSNERHTYSSYCEKLRNEGHIAYGETAEVFISHAHSYLFLDVICALRYHFRDELDSTIIWFDLFSIN